MCVNALFFFFLQGPSNLHHHLMATNVQIIRSSTPALQIGSPTAPPHTFTSHLPRGQLKVVDSLCVLCTVCAATKDLRLIFST